MKHSAAVSLFFGLLIFACSGGCKKSEPKSVSTCEAMVNRTYACLEKSASQKELETLLGTREHLLHSCEKSSGIGGELAQCPKECKKLQKCAAKIATRNVQKKLQKSAPIRSKPGASQPACKPGEHS